MRRRPRPASLEGLAPAPLAQTRSLRRPLTVVAAVFAIALLLGCGPSLEAQTSTAEALQAAGNLGSALQAWDELIDREPQRPRGYLGRGEVLHALGEEDLAVQDLTRAIELAPGLAAARLARAEALAAQGNERAARADAEATLASTADVELRRRAEAVLSSLAE